MAVGRGRGVMMGNALKLIPDLPGSACTHSKAEVPCSSPNKSKTRAINLLRGKPQALKELDFGTYF